jgi:hypothetical protein
MASRSMRYLRKNAKMIMVIMCVVCMFTFVVGTALLDLVSSRQQNRELQNPVAVTWTNGPIRERELERLRHFHIRTYQFLAQVIGTAIQRGGKPVVNGRTVTLDQFPNINVGISADSSDAAMVQSIVLAEEARRMGVAVDQTAVKDFLRRISSPELGEADWLEIAEAVIGEQGGMTVQQLLEHLAFELKAQHVRTLATAGLYAQGFGPIVPPGEAWNLYNRLNRRLAIEAYPIEVEPLVAQVKAEPTAVELQKLFDEGKYSDPNPDVPEPGFRKPHRLAFTYLKVNFAPYLAAARQQITDEQVQQEYEKDVAQGRHKVLDLPGLAPPAEKDKQDGEANAAEKPADAEKEPKDSAQPADPPQIAPPSASNPAPEKPAEKPEGSCQDDPPAKADQPPEAKGAKGADEKTPPANSSQPASTPPADSQPATGDKPADAQPAQPAARVKPLEEVSDEIRTRLAQPIAEDARKKDVAEAIAAIEKYGEQFRRFQNLKLIKKDAASKDPGELPVDEIAAKYNFEVGRTELADQFDIAKYEIGQKVEQFDMEAARQGQFRMLSFAQLAYSDDEPLYRAHEVRSNENDMFYIYFRTAEDKPGDVTLADVRPQIVEFWKRQKAFELARVDAEKLAAKAQGPAALREVVPDPAKIVAPPAFSWMTTGAIGFGRPELSRPDGIDLAGQEFMEALFALRVGAAAAAPNQSHRICYVVRVLSQEPDDEKLQQQFLDSGYNQIVVQLAQGESMFTASQWWRDIEKRYQVNWERRPDGTGF